MLRTPIRGRRMAALVVGALVAVGVMALGPAMGTAADSDVVRVVVQLDEPALAKYRDTLPGLKGVLDARTARGHLDVKASASRAYLAHLAQKQKEFEDRLKGKLPNAAVQWRYDTAFNGVTLEVRRDQIEALRRLPHVASVSETVKLEPELDESRNLLGLQTFWSSLPSSPLGSGAGLRLALIDSGTNAQHPFFNDSGFTPPAGYPKSQRASGGVRTDMPLATYTNNKVIVANVYPYPGNTTATPWGSGSLHATHVAGIMAGRNGTYTYTSGPATFSLQFSGMAPGAYIMSYRLDGDTAEFLAAIEDVVADQADAVNISLGHSRWLTTDPANDPIRAALDGAVDAGTIVAASSGNAGANGDTSITGTFKLSPKVITVANSTHARVFSHPVSVTGPGTVPAALRGRPGVPAGAPAPPIASTVSGEFAVAPGGTAGSAGLACAPLDPATFGGKIAVVGRGTCTFDVKKQNAMAGGAIAMIVHNNGADAPIAMSGFTLPAIPSVMVTLTDGRALVSWAAANASPTVEIAAPLARVTSGWPDVISGSSSRGPALTMQIKPDIAAPGSNILSSVVTDSTGAVNPAGLFDQVSGTSMSTPHITALAGLLKLKHPTWSPAQIKSALMNTASTDMSLDLEGNIPALAKHRGAGRVNAARLANVQLTFDPPSVSFGLMEPSETKRVRITATDMRDSGGTTGFSLNVRQVVAGVNVTPTPTFTTSAGDSTTFNVDLATAGAPAGDYEGFLEITGGGQTYTIPYFVRVRNPAVAKDVLLIDWDRNLAGADFRPVYEAALGSLGLSYDVFDGGTASAGNAGPTFAQLQNYQSVVFFTGNNTTSWAAAHVGGSFPLQDFLVAGGKIVISGQDFNSQYLYDQNVGSDYLYSLMSGWLTGNVFGPVPATGPPCPATRSDRDFYGSGTTAPAPTAQLETAFTLLGHTGDVSTNLGGNGAGNQRFPDAGRTVREADMLDQCTEPYNGAKVEPHARVLGRYTTTKKDGTAVSRLTDGVAIGVAGDPTLGQLDPLVTWNAALLHVGLEGLNTNRGELSPQTALALLHDFVSDNVSVAVSHRVRADRVDFVASASSDSGAAITKYRWDFGDGSPIVETTEPRVNHDYSKGSRGTYTAYVEAVNALTRSNVAAATVRIIRR